MSRRVFETIQELTSRETPREMFFRFAQEFRYDMNRARLTFEAHLYAQARGTLVTAGRVTKIRHYMCYPTSDSFSPDGLLGSQAWKVRTYEQWVALFNELNKRRRRPVAFPGLGLNFHSNELYWPIPKSLLAGAWLFTVRKRAELRSALREAA